MASPQAVDPLAGLPAPRVEAAASIRIRQLRARAGSRLAVLDDDPTGSQSVHGVTVVTVFDPDEYRVALAEPGATCFILTNTRSLPADEAGLTQQVAADLFAVAGQLGASLQIVSRSDSTLRGHLAAEVNAVTRAKVAATGSGYDAVLVAPAFFEAGRVTVADVHWARVGGQLVPAAQTEFARDATFGYQASDLREFVAERTGGAVAAQDVLSVSLTDIRLGGVGRVTEILRAAHGGAYVVVNAATDADYQSVALAACQVQREGRALLYRSGPSWVRALAGIDPMAPLSDGQIWPSGRRPGHGLLAVGSHVELTTRQVAEVRRRGGLLDVELDVASVLDPELGDAHVSAVAERVITALAGTDVLLYTSRRLTTGSTRDASLAIARRVSAALVEVVRLARRAEPSWVIAKGGITSHDLAVHGLGIRRAEVAGQLFPGLVSVFRVEEGPSQIIGMPYVVFAGNVGDEQTLADVVARFTGRSRAGELTESASWKGTGT